MCAAAALPTFQCYPAWMYVDLLTETPGRILLLFAIRGQSFLLPWAAVNVIHLPFSFRNKAIAVILNAVYIILASLFMGYSEAHDGTEFGIWYFAVPVILQCITILCMVAVHLYYRIQQIQTRSKKWERWGLVPLSEYKLDRLALSTVHVHWFQLALLLQEPQFEGAQFDLIQYDGALVACWQGPSSAEGRRLRLLQLPGDGADSACEVSVQELSLEQSQLALERVKQLDKNTCSCDTISACLFGFILGLDGPHKCKSLVMFCLTVPLQNGGEA